MKHPMISMMFKTYRSRLSFEETVEKVHQQAEQSGWHVPSTFDIQEAYHEVGLEDMTRCTVLYFCDPHGGYSILQEDRNKAMSVMMPTGVTIYETSSGAVQISAMNFGLMYLMFGGTKRRVLKDGARKMAATFDNIIEPPEPTNNSLSALLAALVPVGLLEWWRRRHKVEELPAGE